MVENVKLPDWEAIFYALLASAESRKEVKVDDHGSVRHKYWGDAELEYDDKYERKDFDLWDWNIMCCEDEEEYAGECASLLLEKLEKWHDKQVKPAATISDVSCWEQAEQFVRGLNHIETAVYQNACDYLYYGESFTSLIERDHNYGLPEDRTKEIWHLAFYYMAEGCVA